MVLVTGATGFIGSAMITRLLAEGKETRVTGRRVLVGEQLPWSAEVDYRVLDLARSDSEWTDAIDGADTLIHTMGLAHVVMPDMHAFRAVNNYGTARLARLAAQTGVKRFVYLSSVKVNGERTEGMRFSTSSLPSPQDPYGISKWEAEQALARISTETGMETTIIRPPLVYGPGVKGNFRRLIDLIASGIPLPLAAVSNSRSLVSLANLISAVTLCATHKRAAGKTYLVSDGEDLSTPDLIGRLAASLGRVPRLWPCPPAMLRIAGAALGQNEAVSRLTDSLLVDSRLIREELGWTPPQSVNDGLAETSAWYLAQCMKRTQG